MQVVNVSTSKTGKHGHAKANFTATDIFTGKKLEDVIPSTHTTSVPVVSRNEYQLLDISDDGFCSLLTGEKREQFFVDFWFGLAWFPFGMKCLWDELGWGREGG